MSPVLSQLRHEFKNQFQRPTDSQFVYVILF